MFKIKLYPYSGFDEQFCSVELFVSYKDEAVNTEYFIDETQIDGLSIE